MKIPQYFYKVKSIIKVQDGDTVTLELDLGFNITVTHKFRLMDFDAPETYRPKTSEEKEAGVQIKKYLISLLENKSLYVESSKIGTYGRYNGRIWSVSKDPEGNIQTDPCSINASVIQYMEENKLQKEDVR